MVERRASGDAAAAAEVEADKGVYTLVDIAAGSALGDDGTTSFEFTEEVYTALDNVVAATGHVHLKNVLAWADRYSYGCVTEGGALSYWVSMDSVMTFVNHACTDEEFTMKQMRAPADEEEEGDDEDRWHPAYARSPRSVCTTEVLGYAVKAGVQLRTNYSHFATATASEAATKADLHSSWCAAAAGAAGGV